MGESITAGAAEGTVAKLEGQLEAATRERTRVEMVLKALRAKHTQLASDELEDRIDKQIAAATKAVQAFPAAIARYGKATAPVVNALRNMRRMTDIAVGLSYRGDLRGVRQTLGKAFSLWKATRIHSTQGGSLPLWPADDPDAPRTVTAVGHGTRKVGDWPADVAEAGQRATAALAAYEDVAPKLRAAVTELTELDTSIDTARRDAGAAGFAVPAVVAQHQAIRFLDGVTVPDVPDDVPLLELSVFPRRRRRRFAGIEV